MIDEAPCPFGQCDGSGFVIDEDTRVATPCRCRPARVERRRSRRLSAVIPRKYRGVSFDRSPVTDMPEPQVRIVRRFVGALEENLDGGRGLWLHGEVGTGKTTLAMLVSRAALDAGRSVAIYSLPRLLAEIRATFESDGDGSYVSFLDRLAAVDLLHVDDVGAEKTSEWVLEQLYAIVNARYEEERSVVITTNLERDDARRRRSASARSRAWRRCARSCRSTAKTRASSSPDTLRRTCRASSSSASSGATRARARSSISSPSAPTWSCASRAATTPATRSCATGRSGPSTSSRAGSSTPASCA